MFHTSIAFYYTRRYTVSFVASLQYCIISKMPCHCILTWKGKLVVV
jgi:hypothetical protein